MSKIWLDVTTILAWQRAAVGVVRVEAASATYGLECLAANTMAIHFCRFDASTGYSEVAPDVVGAALARIEGRAAAALPGEEAVTALPAQTGPALPLEQRFKALVVRLINRLPVKPRLAAFDFALKRRDAFGAAVRGYRELRQALRLFLRPSPSGFLALPPQAASAQSERRVDAPFGPGDVYVSLGLDWDQKDLTYLYAQKRRSGFKVLLFCHDVIPVILPHLCVGSVALSFDRYFANVAWCADEVLCNSECSRRDLRALLSELGTPIPPLSVVKLGSQLPVITTEAVAVAADVAELLRQRYILCVSTIERRKNHETLYRAYTRLLDQGEKDLPLLVFVGMPGWGVSDLMADLRFDPRTIGLIKILSHVSDADLARLYGQTLFTVFPSIYEGWGLPVGESLAAGKFCLASSAASIPEVGGDFVDYVDPWDVPAWADRLRWYFNHPELVAEKESRIQRDHQPADWPSCAREVLMHASVRVISEGL